MLEAVERDFTAGPSSRSGADRGRAERPGGHRACIERMRRLPDAKDGIDQRDDLPPAVTGIEVDAAGPDSGERAQRLVRAIRALDAPVQVLVGGPAAELDGREGLHGASGCRSRWPSSVVPTALLLFALTALRAGRRSRRSC